MFCRWLILACLLFSDIAQAATPAANQPGTFDYYLLNLSWEPAFCADVRHASRKACQIGGHGFVVHGLWPQYQKGYPEYCANTPAPTAPQRYRDIMPDSGLLRHEWQRHGTCSGLSPDAYFGLMRQARAAIQIPPALSQPSKAFRIAPRELKQAFIAANPGLSTANIVLSCGNNQLTAVAFCLSKDGQTPTACQGLRDCGAHSITVTPVR